MCHSVVDKSIECVADEPVDGGVVVNVVDVNIVA